MTYISHHLTNGTTEAKANMQEEDNNHNMFAENLKQHNFIANSQEFSVNYVSGYIIQQKHLVGNEI